MTLADLFTSIANAIRAKGGTSAPLYPNEMPQAISDIQLQLNLQRKTKSYTPSETAQVETVAADSGYDGLEEVGVSVGAIPSNYVGTGVTRRSSADLSANGATVTAPAGYYENAASKAVTSGSAKPPTTISGSQATLIPGTNTITLQKTVSVTPQVTPGYVGSGTQANVLLSLNASVPTRSSSDLTASGQTVTAPAGYYAEAAQKAVASGSEGTPTATKGTVSNHAVTITPQVTNAAGYIAGGTKTGTGVSVSASELVSGSETITENGTHDVTNLASVVVNVSGGGGDSKNVQVAPGVDRVATTSYTAVNGQTLTVAKTGTYHVYWVGFRSSTSGTNGSQLYIGSTAYGSAQTTFTNNGQAVHLSGVSLTQGQTISVRARARTTSYYMYVGNLTIVEA